MTSTESGSGDLSTQSPHAKYYFYLIYKFSYLAGIMSVDSDCLSTITGSPFFRVIILNLELNVWRCLAECHKIDR